MQKHLSRPSSTKTATSKPKQCIATSNRRKYSHSRKSLKTRPSTQTSSTTTLQQRRRFSMSSPSFSTTYPTIDTLHQFRQNQTGKSLEETPKHPNRPLNIAFFGASDITPAVFDTIYNAIDPESPINKNSTRGYPLIGNIDVITSPPVTRLLKGKRVTEDSPLMAHVKAKYPNVGVSHYSPDKSTPFRTHYELEREKGYYDLAIVFSFPRLIPPRLIEQFSMGMINIHPSLIPLYRGPSPMQAALGNNDEESGVSIITIAPHKFDVGQVIAQRKFAVPKTLTLAQMTPIVQSIGSELVMDLIQNWDQVRPQAVGQDTIMSHYESTMDPNYLTQRLHAPKYGSTISPIFEKQTGKEIYGLWRGLVGFRQIHAKVQGKPKVDKKTGEVSYKEPARIIFAEMGFDNDVESPEGAVGDEEKCKGAAIEENNSTAVAGQEQPTTAATTTTDTTTTPPPGQPVSTRPHLYYNIAEFQPGPEPGDAIFDPHLNAIRVRCAENTTVLVSKFLSTTGQPSDAKAIVNGQFVKEAGKFGGKFVTNLDEDVAKM